MEGNTVGILTKRLILISVPPRIRDLIADTGDTYEVFNKGPDRTIDMAQQKTIEKFIENGGLIDEDLISDHIKRENKGIMEDAQKKKHNGQVGKFLYRHMKQADIDGYLNGGRELLGRRNVQAMLNNEALPLRGQGHLTNPIRRGQHPVQRIQQMNQVRDSISNNNLQHRNIQHQLRQGPYSPSQHGPSFSNNNNIASSSHQGVSSNQQGFSLSSFNRGLDNNQGHSSSSLFSNDQMPLSDPMDVDSIPDIHDDFMDVDDF